MEFRRALYVQEFNSWLNLTEDLQRCKPEGEQNDKVFVGFSIKEKLYYYEN